MELQIGLFQFAYYGAFVLVLGAALHFRSARRTPTAALIDFREECWLDYRLLERSRWEILLAAERYNAGSRSLSRAPVRSRRLPFGRYTGWFTGVMHARDCLSVTSFMDAMIHEANYLEALLHRMEDGRKIPEVTGILDVIERMPLFATLSSERMCTLRCWERELMEHLPQLRKELDRFERSLKPLSQQSYDPVRGHFERLENRAL